MKLLRFLFTLFLLTLFSTSVFADLELDTLLYYTEDDDDISGTSILDSTPNSNDGTNNGATCGVTAKINQACDFDGSNDYIDTGLINLNNYFSNGYTVNLWFKADSLGSQQVLLGQDSAFQLEITSSNEFRNLFVSSGSQSVTSSGASLSIGQFYMVTFVHNFSANELLIYLDGNELASGSSLGSTRSVSLYNLAIGARGSGDINFDGVIDEVYITEGPKSGDDILKLYNAQKDGFSSGQYPFDEESVQVQTNAATSVTATTSQLNGEIIDINEESSLDVYFNYSDDGGTTWTTTTTQTVTGNDTFLQSIESLNPNTEYTYRAIAENATDTFTGDDLTFTTDTVTITTQSATNIGGTSATLNADVSGLSAGDELDVFFQYGAGNFNTDSSKTTITSDGTYSIGISGLNPSTTYDFRGVLETADLTEIVSATELTFTTLNQGIAFITINANSNPLNNDTFFITNNLTINTEVEATSTNTNINQSYELQYTTNSSVISSAQYATNNVNGSFELTNLKDGNYTLILSADNGAYTDEVTRTFSVDTNSPIINNNIPSEINDYTLNLSEYLTISDSSGLSEAYINFTTTDQLYNIINNTSNLTFPINGNISYEIYANDTLGNSVTETGVVLVNPTFRLNFFDVDSNPIESYTLDGVEYSNYTDYNYYGDGFSIGDNSVFFSALGFEEKQINFSLNTSSDKFNKSYTIQNSKIALKVYDATTNNLMSEDVDIELLNTNFTATVTNGELNISEIYFYDGDYQIIATSTNYETESVYFTYNNKEVLNVNVFLIPTNSTNLGVLNVKVETSTDIITNQLVNLLEWDSSSSSFITVSQTRTDSNGDAFFNVLLNDNIYKVSSTREGITKTSTQQSIRISGTIIYLIFSDDLENYETSLTNGITYNLTNTTYNATHEQISFSFNDQNNLVTKACIKINTIRGSYRTQIDENCVSTSTGEIIVNTQVTNLTQAKQVVAVVFDGEESFTLDRILYQSNQNIENALGNLTKWFVLIVIVAVIALGLYLENIEILVIGTIIASWVIYSLFSSTITYTIPLLITIIMLLVGYATFKRRL